MCCFIKQIQHLQQTSDSFVNGRHTTKAGFFFNTLFFYMCHLCHLWKITEANYQREQVVKLFQVKEKQQEEDEMLEV